MDALDTTPDDPASAEALEALEARVLEALREDGPFAAEAVLVEALDDRLVGVAAARRLARIRLRRGAGGTALRTLQDARARFPANLDLAVDEAAVLSTTDPQAAEAGFRAVIAQDPERADAVAWLSDLRRPDDPEDALRLADEAVSLDPTVARAHVARVEALVALAQPDRVTRAVDEGVRTLPGHAGMRLLRALWRLGRHDVEGALGDLAAVQAIAPGHPGLRPALREVVRRRSVLYRVWMRAIGVLDAMGWSGRLALLVTLAVGTHLVSEHAIATGDVAMIHAVAFGIASVVLLSQLWLVVPAVSDFLLDQDPLGQSLLDPGRGRRAQVIVVLWTGGTASSLVGLAMGRPLAGVWGLIVAMLAPVVLVAWDGRSQQARLGARVLVGLVGLGLLGSMGLEVAGHPVAPLVAMGVLAVEAIGGMVVRVAPAWRR